MRSSTAVETKDDRITFRQATREDVSGLVPLLVQLGYSSTLEELKKRFEKVIGLEGYGIVIACFSEQIIGWVAWSVSKFFVLEKTRIHIEGLVVDVSYRGRGIGRKLMAFLEQVAAEHSPAVIDLTSSVRRAEEGTHEFYKTLGYHNDGPMAKVYLRKEIG